MPAIARNVRDSKGRPLVAVTGCGVITSLGRGKEDNWRALTEGRSGIRQIKRFVTEGLRTTIAGTVDFLAVSPFSAPALTIAMATAAAEEALAQAELARTESFPGPLCLATPPAELEWPQRRCGTR
jgi:3-oxoacyl-[acyl-carrier-protein] synthase II